MEVSLAFQLQHCNCYTSPNISISISISNSNSNTSSNSSRNSSRSFFYRSSSLKFSTVRSSGSRKIIAGSKQEGKNEVAARDMTIDFGRYKGKMLGTLPSTYLKWVSNNLRARDFHHWAILADQVLADPIYRDRIEWEFAQKLLEGDVSAESKVSNLLVEISDRFGWDNDDKLGWKKIDFALLGTSKGNPIPRRGKIPSSETESPIKKEISTNRDNNIVADKRSERRERLRMKRGSGREKGRERIVFGGVAEEEGWGDNRDIIQKNHPSNSPFPFPGRQSLFDKRH